MAREVLECADMSALWFDATCRVGRKRRRVAALQIGMAGAETLYEPACQKGNPPAAANAVATCCALGLANLFFRFNPDGSLQYAWMFCAGLCFLRRMAVMLALNSFGAEISSGTFSNLLAQPVPRQKIWETKILLLAATLLIVGIFWSACGIVRLAMLGHNLGPAGPVHGSRHVRAGGFFRRTVDGAAAAAGGGGVLVHGAGARHDARGSHRAVRRPFR